jgi:UMF1 family MFS transporter
MTAIPRKKQIKGWIMFDWANSAYNLVIVSTIFPAVFMGYYKTGVDFWGIHFEHSESLLTLAMSFSYLILAFLTPILSGVADYGGYKKKYMQFFSTLGAVSCCLLMFFTRDRLELGLFLAVMASIGFSGSLVFYNAFLPEIVPQKFQDKISAKGFAFGYFGSSLLLLVIFALITILGKEYTRYFFILVGLWWFGWARWTFSVLPQGSAKGDGLTNKELLVSGFKELKIVGKQILQNQPLKQFLLAFFMIALGVQTIIIIANPFAKRIAETFDGAAERMAQGKDAMATEELIIIVLIMQILGIVGSMLFSKLSNKKGNIIALSSATLVYLLICFACFIISSKPMLYCLAAFMGFAMGGVQSLCRSTYSKLLPETEDHASFFSFYDILEKVAITIGTFCYGSLLLIIDDVRYGVLGLGVFFFFGLILLFKLRSQASLAPNRYE